MLPILFGTLACIYVAGVASAVGVLGAFERRAGNQADWWGVARVALLWPLLAALSLGVWAVFHKRR